MPEPNQTIERCLSAYNTHDAVSFAAAWTEAGVLRVANGDVFQGREQIQAGAEDRFRAFPDWHLELHRLHEAGDHVWLEWTISGTHEGEFMGIPATHRRFAVDGCSHMTMDPSGLIAEDVVYFDTGTYLSQIGLLPEPETAQG